MKPLHYIFLLSGLLPATFVLFYTLVLLPNLLHGFRFERRETLTLLSCLLGLGGYAGLLRLFGSQTAGKWRLTVALLLGGVAGTFLFAASESGLRALRWLLLVKEPDEWFLFAWPAVVSLVFIALLLYRRFARPAGRQ